MPKKMKMSSRNGGVAAAAAAAAAGASPSDEFAKWENPPPNIDVNEGKAVIAQPCATFPTSHLSFSSFDSHHCGTTARI